nr:BPK_HP1_G0044210.mRNA.1.CDS.1 [Saccharomyces cerevisiae]
MKILVILSVAHFKEYQVIGRRLPTESVPEPKLFRMRIFASNEVIAKSRYWYFLQKLHKVKKASGEIVSINQINEAHPTKVKNFGVWVRYDSDLVLTICTRKSETSPELLPSKPYTKTWLPDTELDLDLFTS